MPQSNISLLTTTAAAAVSSSIEQYKTLISQHKDGDLGKHNQIRVYAEPYTEPASGHTIGTHTIRIALKDKIGNVTVVELPAIYAGQAQETINGPSILDAVPDEGTVALTVGDTLTLAVTAVAPEAITYSWYRVSGLVETQIVYAHGSTFVLPNIQLTHAGTYRVKVITNTDVATASWTVTVAPAT